jgi:hypothetical protein
VKPYFFYGLLYYLILFLPDIVTMASTNFSLLSYLVSSAAKNPFAVSKTIGLIFMLLAAALLEPVIVRTVKFRLQKVTQFFSSSHITVFHSFLFVERSVQSSKEFCCISDEEVEVVLSRYVFERVRNSCFGNDCCCDSLRWTFLSCDEILSQV